MDENILEFRDRSGAGTITDHLDRKISLTEFLREGEKNPQQLIDYIVYINGMADHLKEESDSYLRCLQDDRLALWSALKELFEQSKMVGRGIEESSLMPDEVKQDLMYGHQLALNNLRQAMFQLKMVVEE